MYNLNVSDAPIFLKNIILNLVLIKEKDEIEKKEKKEKIKKIEKSEIKEQTFINEKLKNGYKLSENIKIKEQTFIEKLKENGKEYIVAIDFGTSRSGFSFAKIDKLILLKNGQVQWILIIVKTLTQILLDKNDKVLSWRWGKKK
jgi:predicted nucleotide-binding protein (sugar kinase/HSP70/actin superfamily)